MNLNRATLLSHALKKDETGPCQAQPAKTIRRKKSLKKSLTLRSDALQKDDERPAQPPDCALQAAAEPGQKYGSMAASPYRQMKKGQRRPHGVGPKDPKHGFFGALPLRQRGRRISLILRSGVAHSGELELPSEPMPGWLGNPQATVVCIQDDGLITFGPLPCMELKLERVIE